MIEGNRILITGGAGFTGLPLVGRLLGKNHVTVFDDLSRNSFGHRSFRQYTDFAVIRESAMESTARVEGEHGRC